MKRFVITLAILLYASVSAYANVLTINDTTGVTRAEQALADANVQSSIEFSVTDATGKPGDGFEVVLKNEVTGEVFTAQAINGIVPFTNIPSGTWVVSTTAQGITFTNVVITPLATAGAVAGGAAGGLLGGVTSGTVAAGVGATAIAGGIAVAVSENNDNPISPFS